MNPVFTFMSHFKIFEPRSFSVATEGREKEETRRERVRKRRAVDTDQRRRKIRGEKRTENKGKKI